MALGYFKLYKCILGQFKLYIHYEPRKILQDGCLRDCRFSEHEFSRYNLYHDFTMEHAKTRHHYRKCKRWELHCTCRLDWNKKVKCSMNLFQERLGFTSLILHEFTLVNLLCITSDSCTKKCNPRIVFK